MTERGWVETESGWQAADPEQALPPDDLARALTAAYPDEVPSGINDLTLCKNDHVVVVVLDGGSRYYDVVADYLLAAGGRSSPNEHLVLEATDNEEVGALRDALNDRGIELPPLWTDVWHGDHSPTSGELETYDVEGLEEAVRSYIAHIGDAPRGEILRIVTEDLSRFMACFSEPTRHLDYEYQLCGDLTRLLEDRPFLQMCIVKLPALKRLAESRAFSFNRALLDIALSHDKLIVVDGDHVLTRVPAYRAIRKALGRRRLGSLAKEVRLWRRARRRDV